MNREEMDRLIVEKVAQYKALEKIDPNFTRMLGEVRWTYFNMAGGGDGGPLGYDSEDPYSRTCGGFSTASVRGHNYPDCPDEFFREVIDLCGWPPPDRDCDSDDWEP